MKLRPTIFLSGVSSEFASFRDAVEIEIQKKGCFPLNQTSFPPDYRTVEEMLRQRLNEADAVIHIAGFCFGVEPSQRPDDKPRRSYTQMEFDIAREMQKPVYVYLSANAGIRDVPSSDEQPEDADVTALQLAHREEILNGDHFYDSFKNKSELCQKVAQIPIVATTDFRVDISHIIKYAPTELIGREDELKLLDEAWLKVRRAESHRSHILTFVALGGEGKTSLASKWAAELAHQGWPGCDAVFAWSFYSQGTHDQVAASPDLFLKEAIAFFGNEADEEFAASNAGAYEKGQRLARIVGQRRSLLILDGLEPLQYAPTSPTAGELKDSGVAALLRGLAADNRGLCIVTTRYSLPDLKAFWQTTASEVKLSRLSREAGVHLLKTLGVKGIAKEFEILVEAVKGHALTLNLLGTYLRDAHGGDIRRRDLVRLEDADAEEHAGHAFRVVAAYERALNNEDNRGKRALAILRLLGFFDRPMSADCFGALLTRPAIEGLTRSLVALSDTQINLALKRLEDAKLITINRAPSGPLVSVDAHPLLREYFAQQLRSLKGNAWRKGHRRLYEHLCATTPDKPQPTLEDLQPLYQAVAHGCRARMHETVLREVYIRRILRGTGAGGNYSANQLGAISSDLGSLSCFFAKHWISFEAKLEKDDQAFLLNNAAVYLLWLGRLVEARDPLIKSLNICLGESDWEAAALRTSNLSELEVKLGNLEAGVSYGTNAVDLAEKTHNLLEIVFDLATLGEALHQRGHRTQAFECFEKAVKLEPLLVSFRGFRYREFLLADAEIAAWRCFLGDREVIAEGLLRVCEDAEIQAAQSYQTSRRNNWLLETNFDRLILGRAALYRAMLDPLSNERGRDLTTARIQISLAMDGLRAAGHYDELPRGLLSRAWLESLTDASIGSERAKEDLNEAWGIAERGPMRLFMADIHLYRARLFFRNEKYPWESPQKDLEAAERLINECGYHRRDEELADAKRVILG